MKSRICWEYNNSLHYGRSQRNYLRFFTRNCESTINLFYDFFLTLRLSSDWVLIKLIFCIFFYLLIDKSPDQRINLLKAQLSKIIQSGGFFGRLLRPLMTLGTNADEK